ncbi:MAG: hypothetical protein ACWA40_06065 [Planktomarina sp.]
MNDRIMAAHAAGDKRALVKLYAQGADQAKDEDTALFLLTTAYVYALEIGHTETDRLHQKLSQAGRI